MTVCQEIKCLLSVCLPVCLPVRVLPIAIVTLYYIFLWYKKQAIFAKVLYIQERNWCCRWQNAK